MAHHDVRELGRVRLLRAVGKTHYGAVLSFSIREGAFAAKANLIEPKRGVMTTKTMMATAADEIASSAPRRRAGRPRKTQGAREPPAPKRGRRPRLSGRALVTRLGEMVDLLIKENRRRRGARE